MVVPATLRSFSLSALWSSASSSPLPRFCAPEPPVSEELFPFFSDQVFVLSGFASNALSRTAGALESSLSFFLDNVPRRASPPWPPWTSSSPSPRANRFFRSQTCYAISEYGSCGFPTFLSILHLLGWVLSFIPSLLHRSFEDTLLFLSSSFHSALTWRTRAWSRSPVLFPLDGGPSKRPFFLHCGWLKVGSSLACFSPQ